MIQPFFIAPLSPTLNHTLFLETQLKEILLISQDGTLASSYTKLEMNSILVPSMSKSVPINLKEKKKMLLSHSFFFFFFSSSI